MPEGDTIYRAAATLRDHVAGRLIRHATTMSLVLQVDDLPGHSIERIESRGKHLLIHLSNALAIHSHMGMTGAWHAYHAHESWRKPKSQAELILHFDDRVAVCFTPKLLELLSPGDLRHHRWLPRLGPDLLEESFDLDDALTRFRRYPRLPIGEAVMNQTIVSGIGNVYKSELLFLDQLHPRTKVADIADEELTSLITRARKLLKRNVHGGPRRTRFRGDGITKWVYGRSGQPCLKCGTAIQLTRQGDLGRTTYFCPACQMPPGERGA